MRSAIIALTLMLVIDESRATVPMSSEQECAQRLEALGVYFDASRRQFIITIAADDPDSAWTSSLCPRSVSVERLNVTRGAVQTMQDTVARRAFHPDAAKYTYTMWLDLKTAKMVVVTDAPTRVLDPLRREFGDTIVFRPTRQALEISDVRDQRQFLRGYSR